MTPSSARPWPAHRPSSTFLHHMPIERLTLTGADERTDIDQLAQLAAECPRLELGLLYTATPEGRNRYPSRAWLSAAAARLSGRVAIHVCGRAARAELITGELRDLTAHAPRVQVNGALGIRELLACAQQVATLITQHNAVNAPLVEVDLPNHALLVDASGGRGLSPQDWLPPVTTKAAGFAGGLGPDNLAGEMQRITAVARPGAWIDMEGKLRTPALDVVGGDWFDLGLARLCVEGFPAVGDER